MIKKNNFVKNAVLTHLKIHMLLYTIKLLV